MGKTFRAVLLLAAVALIVNSFFGVFSSAAEEAVPGGTVTVYYFHGNFRCPTCRNMEQYAKEVIENDFKDALTSGKLTFKAVNVESKGNEHFVNDYQLYTKALILSLQKDGKEIRSKNLDKIWQLVRDKGQYESYVRDEMAAFLKEA